MKLPFHWTSNIPKHYKNNVIIGDLYRVKNLSSNFEPDIRMIRDKYIKAGYAFGFIHSIINSFNEKKKIFQHQQIYSRKEKKLASKFLFVNKMKVRFLVLLINWNRLIIIK